MKRTRQKPGDAHYVNNREFTANALDEYSRKCKKAEEDGKERPQMSNYLGEKIMRMAERLSTTQGLEIMLIVMKW